VSKTYQGKTTWYVRDAQGNQLSLYDNVENSTKWKEQVLYGSSRLGMWKPNFKLAADSGALAWTATGLKFFELNNHLGNVMAVISDRRTQNGSSYLADVVHAQDYYAFGSLMPGRDFTNTGTYRYGFNGKENDNEVKGEGNQQDYGMRIYDPRIGRFLSVDPITRQYPELTPYQFASNTPIQAIDLDGLEEYHYTLTLVKEKPVLKLTSVVNEKKFLGLIPYKPSLSHVIEYNGETYSFGTHNGFNTIGRTATEAAREFVKNPDAGNFVPNSTVEGMRDVIEAVSSLSGLVKNTLDKNLVVPKKDTRGNYSPDQPLSRDKNGNPKPDKEGEGVAHTQLGRKKGRNGDYTQAREFGKDGKPKKDIDFTDHGRPKQHEKPHQHTYEPNKTGGTPKRGPAEKLKNN